MPDAKPLISNSLKQVVTFFCGAVAMFYAMGFMVVTTYMLGFGIIDISLARARYISVGFFFSFSAALTLLPTAWLAYILINEAGQRIHILLDAVVEVDRERLKSIIGDVLSFTTFYVAAAVFAPSYLFCLAAETGPGSKVVAQLRQDPSTYLTLLWNIVPDWFGPLMGVGFLFGLIPFWRSNTGKFSSEKKQRSGLSTSKAELVESNPPSFLARTTPFTSFCALCFLTPYWAMVAVQTYAAEIYPVIRPGFGGGNFGAVQFVTNPSGANVISSLVRMEDATTSAPVRLLGEGGKYYSILRHAAHKRAVMIEKSLVKGIKSVEFPRTEAHDKPAVTENSETEKSGPGP